MEAIVIPATTITTLATAVAIVGVEDTLQESVR